MEEQKSLRSPTILLQAGSLELREQERWVGGESDKSSELGRLGWADPSPVRGGPPDEQGAKPLERSRHAEAMAGTSLWARFYRQIRRHPALIPMIGFIGLGMGSAALYLLRLALRSPDVCWDRKNNPEPWNRLSPNDQYKFLAVSTDYKKLKKDRPDF